ncbi:hypothetical protein BZG36_05608, partial [Bifiguratus adelaidae]
MAETSGQIITYCVEYTPSQMEKCKGCGRTIPNKSVRFGRITRKSKKEKKKHSASEWWHFKCWQVPELVTLISIEQFRGYPSLNELDQERVQQLISMGVGAKWPENPRDKVSSRKRKQPETLDSNEPQTKKSKNESQDDKPKAEAPKPNGKKAAQGSKPYMKARGRNGKPKVIKHKKLGSKGNQDSKKDVNGKPERQRVAEGGQGQNKNKKQDSVHKKNDTKANERKGFKKPGPSTGQQANAKEHKEIIKTKQAPKQNGKPK